MNLKPLIKAEALSRHDNSVARHLNLRAASMGASISSGLRDEVVMIL